MTACEDCEASYIRETERSQSKISGAQETELVYLRGVSAHSRWWSSRAFNGYDQCHDPGNGATVVREGGEEGSPHMGCWTHPHQRWLVASSTCRRCGTTCWSHVWACLGPLTDCDVSVPQSPLLPPSGDIRDQDPSRIESLNLILTIWPEMQSLRPMYYTTCSLHTINSN